MGCVSLVLLNSVVTVFTYAPMVTLLAKVFGIHSGVTFMTVLSNVAIYLGIPFVIGVSMWFIGRTFFEDRYWSKFLPRFAPVGLLSLLWTFIIMFFGSWVIGKVFLGITYEQTVTFAFTAAGN